jgi:RHS repeat-associated protein
MAVWKSKNGARAVKRLGGIVAALAVCLSGLVSPAPPAGAAAVQPLAAAASRVISLDARRALVRRELSPAGEQAAARAAQARSSAGLRRLPLARLRQIAEQEHRAAELSRGAATGMSRLPLSAVQTPAATAAASGNWGVPTSVGLTGPGGAVLTSSAGCFDGCDSNSMVVPGEPVTLSADIYNSGTGSAQVQVDVQQLCGTTYDTVYTTTVTAPSISLPGPGVLVMTTFNVEPADCVTPFTDGEQNYAVAVTATVVGEQTGTIDDLLFYGSVPVSQTQGCICSPDSSGGTAMQNFRGDAVDTATGEYTDSFTDATTNTPGVPLAVTRNYSSGVTAAGPLGPGWTMPWFASLSVDSAAGTVTFNSENGSQYTYVSNGDGTFTPPLGVLSVLTAAMNASGDVTGYTLTTPQQDVLSFTASGQLTSDVDPTGRGLTLGYSSGKLSSVTDAAGQQATLTYTGSRLTGIALPGGTSITYGYSGGLLTSVAAPGGATTSYSYTSSGLLTSITNPDGKTVLQNTYNSAGQVTSSQDGTGAVTSFSYPTDSGLNETETTDPDGGVWTDLYGGGVLLQTIDPLGGETEYVPGHLLLPVQVTDPLGGVTTLSYDGGGNLLSLTDPLSRQQSRTYGSRNNLLTYTDGNGNTTAFTYNSMDEVTSVIDAAGHKATFTYTAAGNLASYVDPRGNVAGATASNFTTTYAYSSDGQLASVTNADGGTESFTYDAMGFPATVTDPAGLVTSYGYNGQQQVTSITAADADVTKYGYDAAGYLTSRTDPDGHTWTYGYDADGRLVSATNPLGNSVTYAYDGDGNQTVFTDARGQSTTTTYDGDNRPVKITYSDGTPTVSYGYDGDGDVTSVTDGTGSRVLSYDADGELTSGGGLSYTYDSDGNVTSRAYPDKSVVSYTYNKDEQIASVSQGSSTTSYTYNAAGELLTAAQPDKVTQAFTYDGAGRLTKISDATSSAVLDSYKLTLNADGEPIAVAATLDRTAQPIVSYSYDAAGRLAKAGSTSYAYDAAGNLTSATTGTTTTTYSYNADEELTKSVTGTATITYGYNADGDQAGAGSNSYTYNAASELTSADTAAGKATYSYDASGDLTSTSLDGTVKETVWDINNPLPVAAEEVTPSGFASAAASSAHSSDKPAATGTVTTTDYAYGADGLLASMSVGTATFSPVTDWLGSVTGLVSSSGTQDTETSYGAYGAPTTTSLVVGAPSSSIGYAGSYTLPAGGGLDDMGARDYNPATGSFLSLDPMLGISGQPYAYASDVPDYYTDPSGRLFGVDNLIAGGIGAIAGAGGVLLNELLYGKKIKWSNIAIAAASGFVFGFFADECGPICAGAASGFVTDGLTQIVDHDGFSGFSFGELAEETAQGAATGAIDGYLGDGGGADAAEDAGGAGVILSKYAVPDWVIGTADPVSVAANPLGALCAFMDSPADGGI